MSGVGNTTTSVAFTGDLNVDGLISGLAWADSILYYSFPDSTAEYANDYTGGIPDFAQLSAQQMDAFSFALDADLGNAAALGFSLEGFTGLNVQLTTNADAHIRGADSSHANPTAYAYLPSGGSEYGGDVWFGNSYAGTSNDLRTPEIGNYAWHTVIHEIGHALGLEHSHEGQVTPEAYEHSAYTVMSYRAYEGAPLTGYSYGQWDAPQTFMMLDIAALQHMYGASYTANSGDTTYTWNTNGQTLIDGVVALSPGGDTIFATIWDGGGVDTYDVSNFSDDMQLDLRAGGFNMFSDSQRADLGPGEFADGNIYNALMFQGNTASLIENIIAGSGDDHITANQADNNLDGGNGLNTVSYEDDTGGVTIDLASGTATGTTTGSDTLTSFVHAEGGDGDDTITGTSAANNLSGRDGIDTIDGGDGADVINGGLGADILMGGLGIDTIYGGQQGEVLGSSGPTSGISYGSGDYARAANAGNDSIANAIDVSAEFIVATNADVIDSDTLPHISISATGDTTTSVHYYVVNLAFVGTVITLDIDYGNENGAASDMDSWIELYDAAGNMVSQNDDSDLTAGEGGSVSTLDSYLAYSTTSVGVHYVAVGTYNDLADVPDGGTYELQITVSEPEHDTADASDDTLEGGGNGDYLDGGDGFDTASYASANNSVSVNLLSGTADGSHATGDTLVNIEALIGSAQGDNLVGDNGRNDLWGGSGRDDLGGGKGDDFIYGEAGNDTLRGGDGADYLDGGAGIDIVRYNGSSQGVTIDMETGATSGGQAEGDTVLNFEKLIASNHADDITGNSANNRIWGLAGDDIIDAGAGTDRVWGGDDADTFMFGAGDDKLFVMDFEDNVDTLDLSDFGYASLADALADMQDIAAGVRFKDGSGNTAIIYDMTLASLEDDIEIGAVV